MPKQMTTQLAMTHAIEMRGTRPAPTTIGEQRRWKFWATITSINLIVALYALTAFRLAATHEQRLAAVLVGLGAMFLLVILDAIVLTIAFGW